MTLTIAHSSNVVRTSVRGHLRLAAENGIATGDFNVGPAAESTDHAAVASETRTDSRLSSQQGKSRRMSFRGLLGGIANADFWDQRHMQ